jgi:hypothetical protein
MIMPKAKPTVAITPTVHAKMQAAVDYLNAHLFDGELPDAFLVFQRRAHSGGHFAPDRYVPAMPRIIISTKSISTLTILSARLTRRSSALRVSSGHRARC